MCAVYDQYFIVSFFSRCDRLRSCSVDNILENGAEKPKTHPYVNVISDNTEDNEQNNPPAESAVESSSSNSGPPRKPKPFPRASYLRMESQEEQK